MADGEAQVFAAAIAVRVVRRRRMLTDFSESRNQSGFARVHEREFWQVSAEFWRIVVPFNGLGLALGQSFQFRQVALTQGDFFGTRPALDQAFALESR